MAWRQLVVRLSAAKVAEAEALLRLAGAESLSLDDAGDSPLLEPLPGETPLWPSVELRALFPGGTDLDAIAALLRRAAEPDTPVRIVELADADWEAAWRQRVQAQPIGARLWLAPAEDDAPPPPGRTAVKLHMGLAFGTGEHPTTRLCLEWLDRQVAGGLEVVDYGCGSGLLAIAALRLGAERAYATDIDGQALAAAAENARLNDVESRLWIGPPGELPVARVELLVANILASPLEALAGTLAARVSENGRIAVTGILEAQADGIASAYAEHFHGFERVSRGGWTLLTGQRRRADIDGPKR